MAKLFVLSSLLIAVWLPIRGARRQLPQRALMRTIRHIALFNAVYTVVMLYILPRLSH